MRAAAKFDPAEWVAATANECGQVLGVSHITIVNWAATGMPRNDLGKNRYEYPIPDIVRWLRESGPWRQNQLMNVSSANSDEGVGGEQLERLRKWNADKAEIEVRKLRGEYLPRATVDALFRAFAGSIREAGDTLERQHGTAAADVLRDAIEDGLAAAERLLKEGVKCSS